MKENIYFDLKKLKYAGDNLIIGKTVRIRNPEKASIGSSTIIDDFTYISSEIEIGNNSHIASNVVISGGSGKFTLGNFSTLSSHVSVHCGSSEYSSLSLDLPSVPEEMRFGGEMQDIKIGDFVTVGSHSVILPGVDIPEGCAFGAFTLIKKRELKPYHLYVGKECRDLGKRDIKNINKYNKLK